MAVQKSIVRLNYQDIASPGQFQTFVEGLCDAVIRLRNPVKIVGAIKFFENIQRIVARSAINDNMFKVLKILVSDRRHGFLDSSTVVERGGNDREKRRTLHVVWFNQ